MKKKDAYKLLPKFSILKGHFLNRYKSSVEDIFVGHTNVELAQLMYNAEVVNKIEFPEIATDSYTIIVLLEGGQFVGVRSIVDEDNLQDLMNDAKLLDYLDGLQYGIDPKTGATTQS